jgi:3-phenylpropionate/cinnamic acid dioxygenase small subunit
MVVRREDPQVEISKLIYRYAYLIDSGDFEGIGRLFEHAVIDFGGGMTLQGSEAIAGMYAKTTRRYDDGTPHTRHVTTNLIIDVDETESSATSVCYVVVFQQLDDFALQPVWSTQYIDEFVSVDGAWNFARREMTNHMRGDVSRHLLGNF